MAKRSPGSDLNEALMLQINERLFEQGLLTKELYEQAKVRIVNIIHKQP